MNIPNYPFVPAPKTPRLSRECLVTEKIDGCWSAVVIDESGEIFAASRNRWITPTDDNYSFAAWVEGNKSELLKLGPGRFPGEWWGRGVQRNYGLTERRFSLFNASRWSPDAEARTVEEWGKVVNRVMDADGNKCGCVSVVPVLYRGEFTTEAIEGTLARLIYHGSCAAPGFKDPEGIFIYHVAAGIGFKKTILNDSTPKSQLP